MSLDMSPEASETASNKERILSSKTACRGVRVSGGDLCEAEAPTEPSDEKRVSGGDLCEAEAPTEPSGEKRVSCGDLC